MADEMKVGLHTPHGFFLVAGAAFATIVVIYPILQAIAKLFGVTI